MLCDSHRAIKGLYLFLLCVISVKDITVLTVLMIPFLRPPSPIII